MINIAVDIGASSGRLMMGQVVDNQLIMEEVHRFSNGFQETEGTLFWDIDYLLEEIIKGLQKVKQLGYDRCTVGIDTWAVDYVLLDKKGKRLQEVVAYRDGRTDHTIEKLTKKIPKEELYQITGIQFLPFNTLFQLYEEDEELLKQTDKILMVPDYLNYRLTGKMRMEMTNASTTQLMDARRRRFSGLLLDVLGISEQQFAPLVAPGKTLGSLDQSFFPAYDLPECEVVHVASHDTASAVVGTPGEGDHWAYVSSGTWSLLGIESEEPLIHEQAKIANYTNEWGAFQTYRFLKNIMGLWVIQEVRRDLPKTYSYAELVKLASAVEPFQQWIDLNDHRFLHPQNMVEEIQAYCKETDQKIPQTPGELAQAVYSNLAILYALELEKLEILSNKKIDHLYIVGGGGQNDLLNQLTANVSQKMIKVGPEEATAVGNILMQLITDQQVADLSVGRELIQNSFVQREYTPQPMDQQTIKRQFKTVVQSKLEKEI